jgi:HPt (histidine-containing phosphotransfer) domain-containing protein
MIGSRDCLDKLRQLAEREASDPRKGAAKIVKEFAGSASKRDVKQLRACLEDTLLAGKWTIVPSAYLDQHSRWLAVLEGACAQARERK